MLILYYLLMTSFLKTIERYSRLDFKVGGSNLAKSIFFFRKILLKFSSTVLLRNLLTLLLIVKGMNNKEMRPSHC